jgi:hypothetical protein
MDPTRYARGRLSLRDDRRRHSGDLHWAGICPSRFRECLRASALAPVPAELRTHMWRLRAADPVLATNKGLHQLQGRFGMAVGIG